MSKTTSLRTICRVENVGPLLRLDYLKETRLRYTGGRLPAREFKALEDRAVNDAMALQEAVGLDVIVDGEMRGQFFAGPLTEAMTFSGECRSGSDAAACHFPLEQLVVPTLCGFAAVDSGNPPRPATQEAKLGLLAEFTEEVWG